MYFLNIFWKKQIFWAWSFKRKVKKLKHLFQKYVNRICLAISTLRLYFSSSVKSCSSIFRQFIEKIHLRFFNEMVLTLIIYIPGNNTWQKIRKSRKTNKLLYPVSCKFWPPVPKTDFQREDWILPSVPT